MPPESSQAEGPASKKYQTGDVISFSDNDIKRVRTPHDDVVVISLMIANYDVKRVLVDNESSVNMLFHDVFQRMRLLP